MRTLTGCVFVLCLLSVPSFAVPSLAFVDGTTKVIDYTPGQYSVFEIVNANYPWDGSVSIEEISGSHPEGLEFNGSVHCGGTPNTICALYSGDVSYSAAGTYTSVLRIQANGQTAQITITFKPPLSTTGWLRRDALLGSPYSSSVTPHGGVAPYSWHANSALPAGLSLDPATGVVSGTPTALGAFSFTLTLTDSEAHTFTTNTLRVDVHEALAVTTSSLGGATAGRSYQRDLTASGGGPNTKEWSVVSGSLPAGLTLAWYGRISGTPTTPGTANFTVQASCCFGTPATKALSITVNPEPSILTPALAQGYENVPYSQALSANGGVGPLTWGITNGCMPAGLSLSSAGVISGTPVSPDSVMLTFRVTDANGAWKTVDLTLDIVERPALSGSGALNTAGVIGSPYSSSLTLTGGVAPFAWSLNGTLPAGLSLNPSTGVVSGTATTAGVSTFTLTATDTLNTTWTSGTQTITVHDTLTVTTTSLPATTVGAAYSQTLTSSGGTDPKTWAIASGSLPAGVTLNSATGALSGTPTTPGTANFTAQVSCCGATPATTALSIVVNPVLSIRATSLPTGTRTIAYSQSLMADGGAGTPAWSVSSGSLPTGLSLSATGAITGTPTAAGIFTFEAKALDTAGASATRSFTIEIIDTPAVTTGPLSPMTVGQGFETTLNAANGSAPYSWSITSGLPPSGLGLVPATGKLVGAPTTAGTGSFTIRATDANQATGEKTFTWTVNAAPSVTVASLADAATGVTYSAALTASGGTEPLAWSIASGTLPTGLNLNSSTGAISGSASGSGISSFTVKVADANGVSSTASLSIAVNPQGVTLSVSSVTPHAAGFSGSVKATANTPDYKWTAASNASWIEITSATAFTGSGTVDYKVALNSSVNSRTGTITVGDKTLTITQAGQATVTATPSPVVFTSTKGGAQAESQTLSLTSSTAGMGYEIVTGTMPAWLNLTKTSGTLPDSIGVSVDGAQLAIGEYTHMLSINETPVVVTLRVVKPAVTLNTSSLFFLRTNAEDMIAPKSLVISASASPVTYTATASTSSGNWLSLGNTTGSAPGSVTVSVNPSGLAIGEHSGIIKLQFGGLTDETVTLPVTLRIPLLNVSAAPSSSPSTQTDVSNGQLKLKQTAATPPSPTNLVVNSTDNSPQLYQASSSTVSGGNWLRVFPVSGTTPADVTISTNGAGLPPGTYTGTVSIAKSGSVGAQSSEENEGKAKSRFHAAMAANTPPSSAFTLNVSLTVDAASTSGLIASPGSLNVQGVSGAMAEQNLTVQVSGGTGPFYLTKSSPSWMSLSSSGGTLPGSFQVRVNPRGLTPGSHSGTVSITADGVANSPLLVPVSVVIREKLPSISVDTTDVLLSAETGSTALVSAPVRVSDAGGAYNPGFHVSTSANWLSASPTSGAAPATIAIRANAANLAPRVYNGTVSVIAQDTVATIAVRLEVHAKPALLTIGAPLTFRGASGENIASAQTVYVNASSRHVGFTTEATVPWLQASSANTRTPANLRVSLTAAAAQLAPGTHQGAIKIVAPDATNNGLEIPVTLIVDQNAPRLTAPGVTGLSSGAAGPIAPGLYLSLIGLQLPATLAEAHPLQPGFVPTQLGGVRVLFDGKPAPVLKVTSQEVVVMAPYEIAGQTVTTLQVAYLDKLSEIITLPLTPSRPEVAAIVRHADGAPVNWDAPTQPDNVITLAVSGLGATSPKMESVKMYPSAASAGFVNPIRVTIGGQDAEVIWAGPMPGQAPGLIQISVRVPRLAPGTAEVRVYSGFTVSHGGVEVPVR